MNKIVKNSLIVVLSFFLLTGCEYNKKQTDNEKVETDTNQETNIDNNKKQNFDAFKFESASLTFENGVSTLETSVTNTTQEVQYLKEFSIILKDEGGNEIITLIATVEEDIDGNATKIITTSYSDNLTNTASIEYAE